MTKRKIAALAAFCLAAWTPQTAAAADLEVTHWWTSGGEAAAAAEFARLFNEKTPHTWVDGAIAGSGGTARPIVVSRVLGGDPPGATQFNHGRQAEELVEAGLMLDLTDVAEREGWRDFIQPGFLLDACTLNGRVYCVPVNIHSFQWMWISHQAYADAGAPVPGNWDEFVASAPALKKAGKIPLAMGQQPWQSNGAFGVMSIAIAGLDAWKAVNINRDAGAAAGPASAKVFEAAARARELSADSNVQEWNRATNLVITGQAGAQIMGDWAQGEFQVAGQAAGRDYTCLPGLGVNEVIDAGGDAFYFPVQDDPEVTAAQKALASLMLSKEAQVAFNLKKGSLPVRGDIDLSAANDCMRKGLEILARGESAILPTGDQLLSPDTVQQMEEMMVEFWSDHSITAADAQARFAELIANAR